MKILILLVLAMTVSLIPAFAEHRQYITQEVGVVSIFGHEDCFDTYGNADFCVEGVTSDYRTLFEAYHTLHHNHTINIRTVEHLQDEVNVWQTKYTHLLAQQGNSTIQDKVANLTDRMDAVETKAATNESLIYIIQNMLRTVQTDIEDIYLKINSVR